MCGITGFWDSRGSFSEPEYKNILYSMSDELAHRGPDGDGVWLDPSSHLGLGHRRLSIQDLSNAGKQPMHSASGRYVITYNGEIYNFLELRKELEQAGVRFKSRSDTEVLLEAIDLWGLDTTLKKSNGMFAFGLWDKKEKSLTLARDRVGKKPLYYGLHNGVLLFGSELKALEKHPAFDKNIDPGALGLLIRYSWISSPHCIYKNTNKLQPGSYLVIKDPRKLSETKPISYHSIASVASETEMHSFKGTSQDALLILEQKLLDATKIRMISDASLGALLSGGIDSSTVVALMQKLSQRPVKTFSIGYHEKTHNEANHAKRVADYLGTDHHELYVTPDDAFDLIPSLPQHYDEPFADASQIPTMIVSSLAKQHVKVVLTGDGGDETFAGYARYTRCMKQWGQMQHVPLALRHTAKYAISFAAYLKWKLITNKANSSCKKRTIGKLLKLSRRIDANSIESLFMKMNTRSETPERFMKCGSELNTILNSPSLVPTGLSPLKRMQYIDYVGYLIDNVLLKVDRGTMCYGLEARAPLLDESVLKFAWSLPSEMIWNENESKIILKRLLYKYVPSDLVDRPKLGFGVPIGDWLRGPLLEWSEDLLSESLIRQQDIFDYAWIQTIWSQHKARCAKHDKLLWSILMFQTWYLTRFS